MLIFVALYILAIYIIKTLRKTKESDDYVLDYEDAVIDRVSKWFCSFSLATCIGSLLLLPSSILAAEVMRTVAPHSYYWKWLNSSLLQGNYSVWEIIRTGQFLVGPVHKVHWSIGPLVHWSKYCRTSPLI